MYSHASIENLRKSVELLYKEQLNFTGTALKFQKGKM